MFSVSQQQAGQRWDIITPQLREALFSDINADFVWNLCQAEHLPAEKSYQVAEFSGYVLLGFIHPEDLSGELASSLNLPPQLAKTISEKINSRIFTPLRADIDKIYSPLSVNKLENPPVQLAPASVQNIGGSIKQSGGGSAPTQKPITLSDIGWSKMPAPSSVPTSSISPAKANVPMPTPAPIAPKPSTDPAPVMLHQDTTFKAAEKNAGFTLSRPGVGADVHIGQGLAVPTPPRPAVLEFGDIKPQPSGGVVHYTEIKPSLSATPAANSGPRSVSQIGTPPMPPRPQMPSVPMPPRPPQTSTQSPQVAAPTPIIKDFL